MSFITGNSAKKTPNYFSWQLEAKYLMLHFILFFIIFYDNNDQCHHCLTVSRTSKLRLCTEIAFIVLMDC